MRSGKPLSKIGIRGGLEMIEIKETNIKDIDNVQRLWADGDVILV